MKRKLKLSILFSLSLFLLIGCSQNKRGTWGPAWDLPIALPLIDSRTKTVDEFLDEKENIEILDNGIYALKDDMEDMDFEEADIGELLDEVNIDDLSIYEEVELPIIDIDLGEISIEPIISPIGSGFDIERDVGVIDLSDQFLEVEFAQESPNLDITAKNSGDVDIENLTIKFEDEDGLSLGEVPFGPIDSDGIEVTKLWNLPTILPSDISIVAVIDTGEFTGLEEGELEISFDGGIGEVSISRVEGFQLDEGDEVSETISENIAIDLGDDLDGGIEKVVFSGGTLSLDLEDLPQGFDYEVTNFEFASITSQGGSSVDLKGEEIDLTEDLEVQIEVRIFSTGDLLTYNSGEKVGIRSALTDLEIESVLIDINSFEGDDLAGEVESTNLIDSFDDIDGDIREELAKIDLLDAQISLAFKGVEGIDINLEELYIAALDREIEDGQEVIDDYLLDSDNARISLGRISGAGDEIDLVELGLLDMIKNPEAKSIVLYGNYAIEGDKVQIERDMKIGITQVIAEIPLSIRITEDISVRYEAEKVDVTEETKEDIDRDLFKSARLKVKGLKSDFNIGAKVELYLGVFEGEFNEEDFYSNSDNIIETATITANYEGDLEFILRDSDIRKLLEDDIYFGVKGTIFKTDELSIKSGDEISFGEAYSVIVFKVNQ